MGPDDSNELMKAIWKLKSPRRLEFTEQSTKRGELHRKKTLQVGRRSASSLHLTPDQNMPVKKLLKARKELPQRNRGNQPERVPRARNISFLTSQKEKPLKLTRLGVEYSKVHWLIMKLS